jgi:phosphoribosylaminoimidazole carboxylase (NCAIR synthetase)
MYGKLESKPKRKIGHVNLVDHDEIGIEKLLLKMNKLQEGIEIESDSIE